MEQIGLAVKAKYFSFTDDTGKTSVKLFDGKWRQQIQLVLCIFDKEIQPSGLEPYKADSCILYGDHAETCLGKLPETPIELNHEKNVGAWGIKSKLVDIEGEDKQGIQAVGTIWRDAFTKSEIRCCEKDFKNKQIGGSINFYPQEYELKKKCMHCYEYDTGGGAMITASKVLPAERGTIGTGIVLAKSAEGLMVPVDYLDFAENAYPIFLKAGLGEILKINCKDEIEIIELTPDRIVVSPGLDQPIVAIPYLLKASEDGKGIEAELEEPEDQSEGFEFVGIDLNESENEQKRIGETANRGTGEFESEKVAAKVITYKERQELKDSDFAMVMNVKNKATGKMRKIRKLPIHDKAHVRNALARLNQDMFSKTLKEFGLSRATVRKRILKRAKELGMKITSSKEVKSTFGQVLAKSQITFGELRSALEIKIKKVSGFQDVMDSTGEYRDWSKSPWIQDPSIDESGGFFVLVEKAGKLYKFPFTLNEKNEPQLSSYVEVEKVVEETGESVEVPADVNVVSANQKTQIEGGEEDLKPEEIQESVTSAVNAALQPVNEKFTVIEGRLNKIDPPKDKQPEVTDEVAAMRMDVLHEIHPFTKDAKDPNLDVLKAGWLIKCKSMTADEFEAAKKQRREIKAAEEAGDDKGADDKGADDKGADDKGADDKGADDKGADDKVNAKTKVKAQAAIGATAEEEHKKGGDPYKGFGSKF